MRSCSKPGNSSLRARRPVEQHVDVIRIIKHELFRSKCGSFEVRFADGGESKFFHFDDVPNRRVRPDIFAREQALELARAFARVERDKETRA